MSKVSQDTVEFLERNVYFDSIGVDKGEIVFCDKFSPVDDEPTDAAWDHLHYLQDQLESLGLKIVDHDSDNDSLWGKIVEKPA